MAGYSYRPPRRYRYRGYRKSGEIPKPLLVIGAVLLAASAAGGAAGTAHKSHGHGRVATADVVIPGGSDLLTPSGWAKALLAADSLPVTACNFAAVTEWERREGGGFGNQAAYNPLNVNPGPGAGWPGHAAIGAWAFPDAATGLRYTVATLNNGYYNGVLAALRAGDNAQAVCNAIMASPWAASHYDATMTATC